MSASAEKNVERMILYEDPDIIVCRKAAGIPVQSAGVGTMDLESMLTGYLKEKRQQGIPYLGVVHRLDQPVEGIVVFAGNKKAASDLSRQISQGRMKKVYAAACCADKPEHIRGREGEECHLTGYLKKDARTNTSFSVPPGTQGAKKAELKYRILSSRTVQGNVYALVSVVLLTGRHHQIRVQMAGEGLPLYGDRKYNGNRERYRIPELEERTGGCTALCASELTFFHPATGKKLRFRTEPSFLPFFD